MQVWMGTRILLGPPVPGEVQGHSHTHVAESDPVSGPGQIPGAQFTFSKDGRGALLALCVVQATRSQGSQFKSQAGVETTLKKEKR